MCRFKFYIWELAKTLYIITKHLFIDYAVVLFVYMSSFPSFLMDLKVTENHVAYRVNDAGIGER